MTDIDQYLRQNRQTIHDDGFTQRVIENLPARKVDWDGIVQVFCHIIIAFILIFGGGADMLKEIIAAGSTLSGFLDTLLRNGLHLLVFTGLAIAWAIHNYKDRLDL
ncbi:MAG: DUF5056 domain-containing protein [Bacteroidaceae bacterium]|nr:DUF5056 domain-containing protein [Bacteroidaceae bacterium]